MRRNDEKALIAVAPAASRNIAGRQPHESKSPKSRPMGFHPRASRDEFIEHPHMRMIMRMLRPGCCFSVIYSSLERPVYSLQIYGETGEQRN